MTNEQRPPVTVAVDPGKHMGVAIRAADGRVKTFMFVNRPLEVFNLIVAAAPDFVVVERFMTGGRISSDGIFTVENAGMCYGAAQAARIIHRKEVQLIMQLPAQRTPFIGIAREALGVSKVKIESHRVDALAHLLRFEVSRGYFFDGARAAEGVEDGDGAAQ